MQFRPLFLFLCLAMYLTSVRAGAEEKEAVSIANRHEIRIAVSDGITLSMASFLGMGLSDWVTGTKRSEIQSTGVYGIGYRYAINRFKVGADVGFINITSELKYANEKTPSLKEKSRDILVLPTGEFIYYKRGVISLYGSASAGIDFSWQNYKALNPAGKEMASNYNPKLTTAFAYQINPIALRAGNEKIACFVEAGLGYKGFLTVGLSYKFN